MVLEDSITVNEINQRKKNIVKGCYYLFTINIIITCLNSLWGAVWAAAAAGGSFDSDIIHLSTLKTTQSTDGTVSVTGH